MRQAGLLGLLVGQATAQYAANYFDQRIDHFPSSDRYRPHDNGTFRQRYYVEPSYYAPGGPVYLYIGGETSGPSRFSNLESGIVQRLMAETGGLGVILENRYYGESFPTAASTTDELAYLTTEQTIADNAYFAQHVVFELQGRGSNATSTLDLRAPNTPWILYGGSLAGAQTAFSVKAYGDVLYGGIASSAPIQPVVGYPQWYDPIQKYAPSDCVTRVSGIVDNFDALVARGNASAAVAHFKSLFGLESLTDDRDFATALANPLGNPGNYFLNTYQEIVWDPAQTGGSDDFFAFCGNVTDPEPAESVAQVDYAMANWTGDGAPWPGLGGYAAYVKRELLPVCASGDYNSGDCFGTQNASYWAATANSASRSYLYTSCTEQGAYISGPAWSTLHSSPALLSRVIDTSYEQQWCTWAFPDGTYNAIPAGGPDLGRYTQYGGWNFSADRVAFVDGSADVWNGLCYHSPDAPARDKSTSLRPELLINGAGHHWDSYGLADLAQEPQFIREAHKWEMRTVKKWLADFEAWRGTKSR